MTLSSPMVSGIIEPYALLVRDLEARRQDPTPAEPSRGRTNTGDDGISAAELEEVIALGNSVFAAIDHWDAIWHRRVNDGSISYDAEYEGKILDLYRTLVGLSAPLLSLVERFEADGHEFVGAVRLRSHCNEARGLTTADDDFFGSELIALQDEALAANARGETVEFEEMGD